MEQLVEESSMFSALDFLFHGHPYRTAAATPMWEFALY